MDSQHCWCGEVSHKPWPYPERERERAEREQRAERRNGVLRRYSFREEEENSTGGRYQQTHNGGRGRCAGHEGWRSDRSPNTLPQQNAPNGTCMCWPQRLETGAPGRFFGRSYAILAAVAELPVPGFMEERITTRGFISALKCGWLFGDQARLFIYLFIYFQHNPHTGGHCLTEGFEFSFFLFFLFFGSKSDLSHKKCHA